MFVAKSGSDGCDLPSDGTAPGIALFVVNLAD